MELFNPNQMAADFAPLLDLGTGPMPSPVKAYYEKLAKRATQRKENFDTALAANSGIGPSAFNQMVADEMRMARDNQMLADSGMIQGSIGSQAMQPGAVERASSPVTQMMSGQVPVGTAIPEGGNPQGAAGPINFADVQKGLAEYERIVAERPKAPKLEQARLSDGAATLAILVGLFGGDRRAAVDVLSGALQGSQQLADANNKQNVFDFEQELAEWEAKLKPAELTAEINRRLFETQLQQQGMNERAEMMNDRAFAVAGINADSRIQGAQINQQGAIQRTQMQLEQKDRQFVIQNASQNERQLLALYKSAPPATRVRIAQTLSQNPLFAGMSDQELIEMASEPTIGEQRLAFNQEQEKARAERFEKRFQQAEKQFGMRFNADQKDRAFKNQLALDQLELARQRLYDAQSDSDFQRAKFDWERQKFEYEQSLVESKDEATLKELTGKLEAKRRAQFALKGDDAKTKEKRQELELEIAELDSLRSYYRGVVDRSTKKVMDDTDAFIDQRLAGSGTLPPAETAPPGGNVPPPPPGGKKPPLRGNIGGNRPNTNQGGQPKPKPKPKPPAKPNTQKTSEGYGYKIKN